MCEPITLTALAGAASYGAAGAGMLGSFAAANAGLAATMVAGSVMSAAAAYQSIDSQKKTAKYNAQVAEVQGQDATRRGEQEAARVQREARLAQGAQRSGFAAKGLDITGDSSVSSAIEQTAFFGELDAVTARKNAEKEAWNLRARKSGYEAEARNARPGVAAATSLMSSAGSVASRWYGTGGGK